MLKYLKSIGVVVLHMDTRDGEEGIYWELDKSLSPRNREFADNYVRKHRQAIYDELDNASCGMCSYVSAHLALMDDLSEAYSFAVVETNKLLARIAQETQTH